MSNIEDLDHEIIKLKNAVIQANRQEKSWWHHFWKGIIFGIGSSIGVIVILYVAVIVLHQLRVVPILGDYLSQTITPIIEQTIENKLPRR